MFSPPLIHPYGGGVVLPTQAVFSTLFFAPSSFPYYFQSHLAQIPVVVHTWPWSLERGPDSSRPWPCQAEEGMSWQDFVKHVVQGFKIF